MAASQTWNIRTTAPARRHSHLRRAVAGTHVLASRWARIHANDQAAHRTIHICGTGMTKLPDTRPSMSIATQAIHSMAPCAPSDGVVAARTACRIRTKLRHTNASSTPNIGSPHSAAT